MKPEEFNKRLKELAEVINLDEGKFDNKSHPDYPKQVKRIRSQTRLCALECGQIVTNQVIDLQLRLGLQIWLKHCRTCGQYQNPITKEFSTLHLVNQYLRDNQIEHNK
jgi:hypothetical protein